MLKRTEAGFTLVEVLVFVLVIGVLAAIALRVLPASPDEFAVEATSRNSGSW